MRKEKDRAILSDCTFTPNISLTNRNCKSKRAKSSDVSTRLYSHAMNKLFRIKSIYEERKALDVSFEKEARECTFVPMTSQL